MISKALILMASGSSVPVLTEGQTELDYDGVGDNGTFLGGNAQGGQYQGNPTLVLSNGAEVRVDNLSGPAGGRVVTEFTVTKSAPAEEGVAYPEVTFSLGFSITPNANNLS